MWEKMIVSDEALPACLQLGPYVCEGVSWGRIKTVVPESDSEASFADHDLVLQLFFQLK